MNYDAERSMELRDGTHAFSEGTWDAEFCGQCGKRRWAHVNDGHKYRLSPEPTKEENTYCRKSAYSRHPGWNPPQGASRAEAKAKMIEELKRMQAVERKMGRS